MTLDEIAACLTLEGCPLTAKQYAALVDLSMKGSKFNLVAKAERERQVREAIRKGIAITRNRKLSAP